MCSREPISDSHLQQVWGICGLKWCSRSGVLYHLENILYAFSWTCTFIEPLWIRVWTLVHSWSVRCMERSCSHCLMFQWLCLDWSVNNRLYVCEIRWARGLSLKQRSSNGVVGLDQSGVGLGLIKKFLSWTYVQKGKFSAPDFEANSVWDRRRSPSKKCLVLAGWWAIYQLGRRSAYLEWIQGLTLKVSLGL